MGIAGEIALGALGGLVVAVLVLAGVFLWELIKVVRTLGLWAEWARREIADATQEFRKE